MDLVRAASSREAKGAAPMDDRRQQCYARVEGALRWPMAVLAVVFTIAFVLSLEHTLAPRWLRATEIAQDAIWLIFALEYFVLLGLAADKRLYFRTHVLELLSILLPSFRLLRVVRVLRLVPGVRVLAATAAAGRGIKGGRRVLRRNVVAYAAMSLFLILLIGAAAVHMAEGHINPALRTYSACLWWSTVTAVGYGDALPLSVWGKVLTVVLMITGIGLLGVVTAAIASCFVEIEREDNDLELRSRLDEMSKSLTEIGAQLKALRGEANDEDTGAA